jgi:hypothetical protein
VFFSVFGKPSRKHSRSYALARKRKCRPCGTFVRPWLEILEQRIVLSTVYWSSASSGDWDTPSNWSTGQLPGPADDVVINQPGVTVTHSQSNSDAVNSVTSSDQLLFSNGSLAVAGNANFSSNLKLSGGTFKVTGSLQVTSGGTFTLQGGTLAMLLLPLEQTCSSPVRVARWTG